MLLTTVKVPPVSPWRSEWQLASSSVSNDATLAAALPPGDPLQLSPLPHYTPPESDQPSCVFSFLRQPQQHSMLC